MSISFIEAFGKDFFEIIIIQAGDWKLLSNNENISPL